MNASGDDKSRRSIPPARGSGPLPWLRLWHEFLDNIKVRRVTEALRARYIDVLCVSCRTDDGGRLPSIEIMAFMCRLDEQTMSDTIDALVKAGLIDRRARHYYVHDWEQWQWGKSKAAERQKRYRDRRNALRNAEHNAERDASATRVTSPRARQREIGDKKEILPTFDALPSVNGTREQMHACEPSGEVPEARREMAERTRRRLDDPGAKGKPGKPV